MRFLLMGCLGLMAFYALAGPASAAWHEAKSRHFILYGDMDPAEIIAFGKKLERFDQAVRKLRAMDDPPLTDAQRLTVYALKSEEAVGRLINSGAILGFYVTSAAGSYAYVPTDAGYIAQRLELDPDYVLFHEYAHHLQLSAISAALPAWLTEGFAEFFGTAEILEDGSVRIGSPPQIREWSVQRRDGLPLHEMLGGTLRNISGRGVDLLYGRGWLLTHMLTFSEGRQGQLQRYIDQIQAGLPADQAAKTAFGNIRSLDSDLDGYLRQSRFKSLVVDGSALDPGPMAIRALGAGEIAAIGIQMRARLDPDDKQARRLVADARRIAGSYPNDSFVQTALGEAELAAKEFAGAEAAGRRAVAGNRDNVRAQIVLGRALLEQARKEPEAADWKEVRRWFLSANKRDPENAEPLMLFYRSFPMANQTPTPNAINALLYALVLAPRDTSLRLDAVHQLVLDNRLDEARKTFAPIAFYPHSTSEWRAKVEPIEEALERADRQTALALLRAEQQKRWSDGDDED